MSAQNAIFARPLSGLLMTPALKAQSRPPSTPVSVPKWETLPELPSSISTNTSSNSTQSKRTIDDIDELDSPSTPVKKRTIQGVSKAGPTSDISRFPFNPDSELTLMETPTPPNVRPLFLPSISSMRSSRSDTYSRNLNANESPCQERVERHKAQRQKNVRFAEPPVMPDASLVQKSDHEVGLSVKGRKRKRVATDEPTTESSHCSVEKQAVAPLKRKKRKKSKGGKGREPQTAVGSEPANNTELSSKRSKKQKGDRKKHKKEQTSHDLPAAPDRCTGIRSQIQAPPSSSEIAAEISVAEVSPLPESYTDDHWPASEDTVAADESDRWVHNMGFSLGLSKDNVDVLEEIDNEPDDKKHTFLVAQHMAQWPWKIPERAKLQFNEIARNILLTFTGAFLFKDRSLNTWKFLEHIRMKLDKVGLDSSWTTDLAKLKALEIQWQRNFSEARRYIIEAIAASVDERLPLVALARSLGKKEATSAEFDMLSLLRQLYREGGRKTFFTRVDKMLKLINSCSLREIKRAFKRFRKADAKEFPDCPADTHEHGRKSSKEIGKSESPQSNINDVSKLGRQYRTDSVQN